MPDTIMNARPIQVGSVLVQRVPSSAVRYRVIHAHYWRGYLCPVVLPPQWIGKVGKLIEVTSREQLEHERNAYRAEIESSIKVELTYYEVINAAGI